MQNDYLDDDLTLAPCRSSRTTSEIQKVCDFIDGKEKLCNKLRATKFDTKYILHLLIAQENSGFSSLLI